MTTVNKPPIYPVSILIVDDDSTTCLLLELILKQKNCFTSSAYSLTEAAIKLKEQQPDAVFLDNQLPDGRGIDFIDFIKQISPSIKIILITGAELLLNASHNWHPDYFLEKPLTKNIINKIVDNISESVLK